MDGFPSCSPHTPVSHPQGYYTNPSTGDPMDLRDKNKPLIQPTPAASPHTHTHPKSAIFLALPLGSWDGGIYIQFLDRRYLIVLWDVLTQIIRQVNIAIQIMEPRR